MAAAISPSVAVAADFRVTTTADGDDKECALDCTLREAVVLAGSGDQVLVPSGTYVLTGGELSLNNDTIVGEDARKTVIDGDAKSRVLRVIEVQSRVSNVTIRNGNGVGLDPGAGGGIFIHSGSLLLQNSTVSGNTATTGGGIAAAGTATMIGVTVSGNRASAGRLTRGGGIITSSTGGLLLGNSTVSGNTAVDESGASSQGGGIYSSGTLAIIASTIANNSAAGGGGLFVVTPPTGAAGSVQNSIIAHGTGGACGGDDFNATASVASDATCQLKDPSNLNNVNPQLAELADNGGPTNTHALQPTSPAIGHAASCATLDQRGFTRVAPCDSGAYEYLGPTLEVVMRVVNDSGGNFNPSRFSVHVRSAAGGDVSGSPQPGDEKGTVYTLAPGTYAIGADAVAGYTLTLSGDCSAGGSITLQEGQARTCTITADDVAPTLRVVTSVVNNDGGTLGPANFTAHVRQGTSDVPGSPQAGTASGTTYTVSAGATYTVAVDAVTGYTLAITGSCAPNGTITLQLAQNLTCTITANDVAPTLRVITNVINDEGGTLAPANFTAHVKVGTIDVVGSPKPGTATGSDYTLSAGQTYTVSADAVAGYMLVVTGTCAANGNITLTVGQNATCTITARDIAPTLRVTTNVVNDNGGTLAPGNFSAHIRVGANDVNGSPQAGTSSGTLYMLSAGVTYTVSAEAVSGYTFTVSGHCAANGTITMQLDEDRECTITANDVAPRLTVVTSVVNDSGGTRAAAEFSLHVRQGASDVPGSPQPGSATGALYTLTAGTPHTVAADSVTGYTFTQTGSCSATLQVGQTATCTITADDVAPTLTVVTTVVNDDGGTRTASGFSLHVRQGASDVSGSPKSGSATGAVYTVRGGTAHTVAADSVAGYTFTASGSCSATLQVGQTATCTMTANDVPPTLKVITDVENDAGGTRAPSGFNLRVRTGVTDVATGPGDANGTIHTLRAGPAYTVVADTVSGYDFASVGSCVNAVLQVGENATCTVTARDIAPTLTVITHVVTDSGGALTAANVTTRVREGANEVSRPGSESGTPHTLVAGPTYTVSADAVTGYTRAISGDCATNGTVTLSLGQSRTCTITLDDVAPTLRVATNVNNNDGGDAELDDVVVHVRRGAADVPGSPKPGTADPGAQYDVIAGSHTVAADSIDGYSASYGGACAPDGSLSLALAQAATCTVTLEDGAATLNVATDVVNDDGGAAEADDFDVSVRFAGAQIASEPGSPGSAFSLAGNSTYTVVPAGVPGYAFTVAGDCAADGSITLALRQTRSCTVTANDVAPRLTVVTQVVNDNGGAAAPSSFTVHVRRGGTDVAGSPQAGSSGTAYTLSAGAHVVSADAVSGYSSAISGDCAGDGSITLAVGDDRTCTVTANDDPPPVQAQGSQQQLPPPEPGKSVNALPESGTVKVKVPGSASFVTLDEAQQLPVGTVIDATKGHVTLVAAANDSGGTATAEFWAGIFKLGQTKGKKPTTILTLVEKLTCPKAGKASVAAKKKKKRRLWGDGSGKFRTKGKHSAATVVGTRWLVEDTCKSTLTRVKRGRVSVRDFVKKRTVIVRAGKKYVAKAKR